MPRTPPLTATLLALLALTACGRPPELREPPATTGAPRPSASATPSNATPTAPATATPSAPAAPTAPAPDPAATPCRGTPSGDRIVALLRGSAGVLPRNVRVTVRTGPLCAEGWHYTVLAVAGHEELQAVTRGRGKLTLVTAGTDVCGVEVRATAPPGIRTLACDGVPGA
ncbi:hypothetical protein [Micromonospora robiginosa]|uniref:Lipoprotein n=1 Tax=Micromonospora robiginosa TaxID=2749844 RepID=A0A7L6BF05_9ACTN|nr:hypothetical protein [Micromonospora ferruginea]QLQ40240.2 hypothetical protein H1D33_06515 [Micromonospora ferruginea]